ncbi:uncharacterized protein LOC122824645 [Tachysurus ichikawai]
MPPKAVKSGHQSKPSTQNDEDNLVYVIKQVHEVQSSANTATNDDILGAIHSLRADFSKQTMMDAIKSIKTDLINHLKRIGEAEERISQIEVDITALQHKVKELEGVTLSLCNKIQDLENRGRRSNLRLIGLPEKTERLDVCTFLENWLPNLLSNTFKSALVIERAHRVRQINPNRPTADSYL